MIVMMPWVLRTWRGLRGRPRIETRGLATLDRLRDEERSSLAEAQRLRRDLADIADLLMDARRRHDG